MKPTIEKPKVFISYAWGSQEYQDRVLALARDLQSDGIDVLLDKWSLKEGNDTYAYMEQSVTNSTVTNVLILLDPIYAQKANNRTGGVGTETQIISPEIYNNVTQEKFLPVVMERDEDDGIPKPSYLKSLLHFDLSKPDRYEDEYKRLVKRLYGIEIVPKPTLGKMPRWVTEESTISSSARAAVSALKRNPSSPEKRSEYIEYLNTLRKQICEFNSTTDSYLDLYTEIKPFRDEYLHYLKASSSIEDSHVLIGDFLQELYYDLTSNTSAVYHKDLKQLLLHEVFIYSVAFYHKAKDYKCLEYLLNRTYFGIHYRNSRQEIGYHIFYHHSDGMDRTVNSRDNMRYYSGTAQYWIENIATEICNKKEFAFADVLLCNYSIYGKNYRDDWAWFPITYVYGGEDETSFQKLAASLKSLEVANIWTRIFGYNNVAELKKKISEVNNPTHDSGRRRPGYNAAFYKSQLIGDFIKPEEVGIYR